METRLTFTPDATFVIIEVTHESIDSTTQIFNTAVNRLNESKFYDWAITKIEWNRGVARFTCEP